MIHLACTINLGILVFACICLMVMYCRSDQRRIEAEEELARLKARLRIHQWGPDDDQ